MPQGELINRNRAFRHHPKPLDQMSNPVAAAPLLGHDGATPRAAIRAALDLIVEPNAPACDFFRSLR